MTQTERRDAGMAYHDDPEVMAQQAEARKKVQALNRADGWDFELLSRLTCELIDAEERAIIMPPFRCDYGSHIHVGKNFYANYNCTILDVAAVTMGDNVLLAPNVAIYTAGHPAHPTARNSGYEYGTPVTIGDNVWIGGNAVILPGVTIGDNAVIGAGSVVSRDVPANVIAAGNPCRVIREITDADKPFLYGHQRFDDEAMMDIYGTLEP